MLELAVWRGVSLDPVLFVSVPGDVSGGVRDHVVLLLLVLADASLHLGHHVPVSGVEQTLVLQDTGHLVEVLHPGIVPPLKVADDVGLLVVHVIELLQLLELHHGAPGLVLDKVEESLSTSLTPVLFLTQDSVPDELDGWIFGDVESGPKLAVLVTVHLAHHHLLAGQLLVDEVQLLLVQLLSLV